MKDNRAAFVGVAGVIMMLAGTVQAGDTDQRRAVEAQSRSSLASKAALRRLERGPAREAQVVADALLSSIPADVIPVQATRQRGQGGVLRINGNNDAYLEISADAASGRYYNSPALTGVELNARKADGELISIARAVVDEKLVPGLQIMKDELYPIMVRHQIHTNIERATGATTRQVLSSEVVFGRRIDDVPVIGPGSKIFVELSNDGELVSYGFDWSPLRIGNESQPLATVATVVERAARTLGTPPNVGEFSRFECGYYDQGQGRGSPNLQSACLAQLVTRDANGAIVQAVEEYVPAGDIVAVDAAWPLSEIVNGRAPASPAAPPSGPARP